MSCIKITIHFQNKKSYCWIGGVTGIETQRAFVRWACASLCVSVNFDLAVFQKICEIKFLKNDEKSENLRDNKNVQAMDCRFVMTAVSLTTCVRSEWVSLWFPILTLPTRILVMNNSNLILILNAILNDWEAQINRCFDFQPMPYSTLSVSGRASLGPLYVSSKACPWTLNKCFNLIGFHDWFTIKLLTWNFKWKNLLN